VLRGEPCGRDGAFFWRQNPGSRRPGRHKGEEYVIGDECDAVCDSEHHSPGRKGEVGGLTDAVHNECSNNVREPMARHPRLRRGGDVLPPDSQIEVMAMKAGLTHPSAKPRNDRTVAKPAKLFGLARYMQIPPQA